MEEVEAASVEFLDDPDLEEEAPFFTEEEAEPSESEEIGESSSEVIHHDR